MVTIFQGADKPPALSSGLRRKHVKLKTNDGSGMKHHTSDEPSGKASL